MKKNLFILSLVTLTLFSCKKNEVIQPSLPETTPALVIGEQQECPVTSVTLFAGKTIDAGNVTVTSDANFIYVTYNTANGWVLQQTHLYVGSCATIPVNNPGNPIPGHFPYNSTHSYTNSYTYQVPISAIPSGECGCIAAHAVVVKLGSSGQVTSSQTGWGNGTPINPGSGNWGMKFDYCSCPN